MNEDITKDRSPRSPLVTLEDAIAAVRKLHLQARTAAVKPESAVRALGFSGMTGSSATMLATLGQYGLIDRVNGNITVTPLAVRILHPNSDLQREAGIREAASLPKVFTEQLRGFELCSAEIIANHLIQEGFNPDRARKVASVYLDNIAFAKLDEGSKEDDDIVTVVSNEPEKQSTGALAPTSGSSAVGKIHETLSHQIPTGSTMLAQYTIPLGENQATLVFTGSALTVEDFDALSDFVEFAKKQFARKSKHQADRSPAPREEEASQESGS